MLPKWIPLTFVAVSVMAFAGCKPTDEVASYEVPRETAPTSRPDKRGNLTYTVPPGWEKKASSGPIRTEAAFQAADGNRLAEVTVTPLPGEAGGLLANVNRWRGQIKLGPTTEEQLRNDARELTVDGTPAPYVDLVGPEAVGPGRQRILAVLLPRGRQTWFFKMQGPADLVEKQKPAFEAFMASVRFAGTGE